MTNSRRRSVYPPPAPPDAGESGVATHDHKLPRRPFIILGAALVLLFVSTGLTFLYGLSVQHRLEALERDYQALKIQRNQQLSDLDMRINEGMCDLLDTLPASPLLDGENGPRDKYGCGPGLPFEQLSPEAQRELGGRDPAAPQIRADDALPGAPDTGGLGPTIPPAEPEE